jgi:hypothetical protein
MASRAMQAQMTGVDVTGQNLANVSTPGYTRQTVDIQTSPDISTSIGQEGTGANVVAIQRAVNTLLNSQIVTQSKFQRILDRCNRVRIAETSRPTWTNFSTEPPAHLQQVRAIAARTDTGLVRPVDGTSSTRSRRSPPRPPPFPARQALVSQAQTRGLHVQPELTASSVQPSLR